METSKDTNLYGYVLTDPVNLIDPKGTNPLDDARKRVKKCKEFIKKNLNESTCESAKKVNEEYECKEWDDNLGEILNPKNWGFDDPKKKAN